MGKKRKEPAAPPLLPPAGLPVVVVPGGPGGGPPTTTIPGVPPGLLPYEPISVKVGPSSGPGPAAKKPKDEPGLNSSIDSDTGMKLEHSGTDFEEEDLLTMPPKEDLQTLLDRIEAQLPRDDHVKYDSRVRKLDWDIIKFKHFSAEDCKKFWEHIQTRIRRFRIMSELIPDARQWLSQPWTNFYKSKDHNRHPEMPKKPLSMYMLYYSERREDIQKDHPSLSMPDVAKICSDEYQKLSEESKQFFKERCDNMRREYDEKLESFYRTYPDLRPIKADKSAKNTNYNKVMKQNVTVVRNSEPDRPVILLPGAPQKPGKPFDLFFQNLMEGVTDQTAERGVQLERARQEWREMKVKRKAKWIRKAMQEFRAYEDRVQQFKMMHPEFNPPSVKSFLTQEEQKILDKHMGRPEKPPSSAYSLFSKEMLNNEAIKQYPSKERMSHISEAWKKVSDAEKEVYQAQVNEMMTRYKQEYNDWYESLTEDEKKAEKERTVNKNAKKNHHNNHHNTTAHHSSVVAATAAAVHHNSVAAATAAAVQQATAPMMQPASAVPTHLNSQTAISYITGSSAGGLPAPGTTGMPPGGITVMSAGGGPPQPPTGPPPPTNQTMTPQQSINLGSATQIQNITVPYGGQASQPMFVKVEVVGGPNGSHTQLIPQISIPNTATSIGGYSIGTAGGGYTIQLPTVSTAQAQQLQYTTTQQLPTSQIQQPLPQLQTPAHQIVVTQGQPITVTSHHQPITAMTTSLQPQQQPPPPPQQQLQTTAMSGVSGTLQPGVVQQSAQQLPQLPQPTPQPWVQANLVKAEKDRIDSLKSEILRREPFEPARSHKQLFISDYVKKHRRKDKKTPETKLVAAAKDIWRETDKKDKKKWLKMLEPQRQRYIEAYTIFVRGLNKEELELYTDMKARRDAEEEARRANESEDSEESSSDDDSESDSETGSDSDL